MSKRVGGESDEKKKTDFDWTTATGVEVDVMNNLVEVPIPRVGVLVLKIAAARPHLVDTARVVLELQRRGNERIDLLIDIIVMATRVVLDLFILVVVRDWTSIPTRRKLASEDIGFGTKRCRTTPDPLQPMVRVLPGVRLPVLRILVVRAAPKEGLHSSLRAE